MSKIVIDSKLAKRIVKVLFYGTCYASAYGMDNKRSINNTFDKFVEVMESNGWDYTFNGEIRKRR